MFRTHEEAYTLNVPKNVGAPTRFYYRRARVYRSDMREGWAHVWVSNEIDWGKWEPIADMRFNDEQEIEEAMRNMARLGLDTGPIDYA